MTQDFGFTVVLGKQAHSRLRNCFSGATVGLKDKSDSGINEVSLLSRIINLITQSVALSLPFMTFIAIKNH